MHLEKSHRAQSLFWAIYALAWLPYFTGLITVLKSEYVPPMVSLMQALQITLPLAIGGVFLVCWLRLHLWNPQAKQYFFLKQVVIAITFIGVTLVIIAILGNLIEWRHTGKFQLKIINNLTPLIVFNNLLIFCSLSGIINGLELSERLHQEADRRMNAELLQGKAELQVLRAQLNPHFLFNTLHSLQALVRIAPERAEDALDQFGALMRYPLQVQQRRIELVSLAEEWEFILNYLELEKLRFGERLRVESRHDDAALDCFVPALFLQPLVENAVRYAVEPRKSGATIRLEAFCRDENLHISLSDDGPGVDPHTLEQSQGIGLGVARKRFAVLYGDQGQFEINTAPNQGFAISLRIPIQDTP